MHARMHSHIRTIIITYTPTHIHIHFCVLNVLNNKINQTSFIHLTNVQFNRAYE